MHFDIRLMRNRGKPLARRQLDTAPVIRGDVYIRLEQNTPMGRPSLIAELLLPKKDQPNIKLYDVQVHGMATLAMVITGTEVIAGGVAYAQSWHCKVPTR